MDSQFIKTSTLKKLALIDRNINDDKLAVVIQRVQKAVLRPALGTAFYKHLSGAIAGNSLTPAEVTLMDDYIIPLMVAACDRKAINAVLYDIRAKGVVKMQDPDMVGVSESENLRLDNDIRQDVRIAKDDLIGFLKDNCADYPEYEVQECNNENIQPEQTKGGANTISFI